MEIRIRARCPADVTATVTVLAAVQAHDGYPVHWPADPAAWLTPAAQIDAWVAEQAGALVGHIALRHAGGELCAGPWVAAASRPLDELAVITRLFVAPGARGQGVGRRLLAVACAAAAARGWPVALDVLARDRAAVVLYERMGWRRVGQIPLDGPTVAPTALYCYLAPG